MFPGLFAGVPGVDQKVAGGPVDQVHRRLAAVGLIGQLLHQAAQLDDPAEHRHRLALPDHRHIVPHHLAFSVQVQLPVRDMGPQGRLLPERKFAGGAGPKAAGGDHLVAGQQHFQPGEKGPGALVQGKEIFPFPHPHGQEPGQESQFFPVAVHHRLDAAGHLVRLLGQAVEAGLLLLPVDPLGDQKAGQAHQQHQNHRRRHGPPQYPLFFRITLSPARCFLPSLYTSGIRPVKRGRLPSGTRSDRLWKSGRSCCILVEKHERSIPL